MPVIQIECLVFIMRQTEEGTHKERIIPSMVPVFPPSLRESILGLGNHKIRRSDWHTELAILRYIMLLEISTNATKGHRCKI